MAGLATQLTSKAGVRVAVEGCGHGTLNAIYDSVKTACSKRGWDGVDILIIGGDFQAVRNPKDLNAMSVPAKYRTLGDFHEYYSGIRKAPYLTMFIAGNHEASNHLWELFYGGWAAPNIYYMGAVNVLRLGPIRIAGLSGIWKGRDYQKPHYEQLPFNSNDVKSFYHVREIDVRRLLLMRSQVDIGLSHDWPRGIEWFGDTKTLFRKKPFFEQESKDGTLGSVAASYVLDRLRPPYWFSAHLHVRYPALKKFDAEVKRDSEIKSTGSAPIPAPAPVAPVQNNDEIDLDIEDDGDNQPAEAAAQPTEEQIAKPSEGIVADEVRAQPPASFATLSAQTSQRKIPGQPVPEVIPNKEVRFLALDKCLPGRHYLQLANIIPYDEDQLAKYPPIENGTAGSRFKLQYDPEWLAINRVFANSIVVGDYKAENPPDLGKDMYAPMIDAQMMWVQENIVDKGQLDVPENFEVTAPVHNAGEPEVMEDLPIEYTNPQTATFCELLGIKNQWDASEKKRAERQQAGPRPTEYRSDNRRRLGGRGGKSHRKR